MATITDPATHADRNAARYTRVAIVLHWTIAALIVLNLAIGLLHDSVFKGWIPAHKAIGMTVLLLSLVRLGWRLGHPAPAMPRDIPAWQRGVAHASHWAFYLLMLMLPISGWIFTSAAEKRYPLDFFGLFPLPYLPIGPSKGLAQGFNTAHGLMGWVLLALFVLHVAAALKHHFVDRDAVLARMTPGVRNPAG
jgi:cytochrome b561